MIVTNGHSGQCDKPFVREERDAISLCVGKNCSLSCTLLVKTAASGPPVELFLC